MDPQLIIKALKLLKEKPALRKVAIVLIGLVMIIPLLLVMVMNSLIGDLSSLMAFQKMAEDKYKQQGGAPEIEVPREFIQQYYIPASLQFGVPWSILAGIHGAQTKFAPSGGLIYNDAFDLPDEFWDQYKMSKRDYEWHQIPHTKEEKENHDHYKPNRDDLGDIVWTVARYFESTTEWGKQDEVRPKIKAITGFNDKTDQAIGLAWAYNLQYGASSTMLSLEPSDLARSLIPPGYIELYKRVEEAYQVPWNIIAAIHYVETRFGTYVNPITGKLMISETGAQGHFQCKPGQGSCGSFDVETAAMGMGQFIYDHGFPPTEEGEGGGDEEEEKKPDVEYALAFLKQTPNYYSIIKAQAGLFAVEAPNMSIDGYVIPVKNFSLSSKFGPRSSPCSGCSSYHKGIDMAAPLNTTIYSYAAGKVVYAGRANGYGTLITIDHGNGFQTRYGHSRRLYVSAGQEIPAGYPIAAMGAEGNVTGSHLHFEVMINGKQVDPLPYVTR